MSKLNLLKVSISNCLTALRSRKVNVVFTASVGRINQLLLLYKCIILYNSLKEHLLTPLAHSSGLFLLLVFNALCRRFDKM